VIFKLFLIAHLLGSAAWIGGHLVLLWVVVPAARRAADTSRIVEFERAYGRIGLAALGVQVLTGVMLARPRLGGFAGLLRPHELSQSGALVIAKIFVLGAILVLAAHASRRVLPRLSPTTLDRFVLHARLVTGLSTLLLVLGVGIRTGGLV